MANIICGCHSGEIQAVVKLVVSPKADTPALHRAEALGVNTLVLSPKECAYPSQLLAALRACDIDLVCLAGYMTLLPGAVVDAFRGRILNIHPALLPKFGGKGMYGFHVHEAVLAAGETESGCTVHHVTEIYDKGSIVVQKTCEVKPDDTVDTLSARVLDLEHAAYRDAINQVLAGLAK